MLHLIGTHLAEFAALQHPQQQRLTLQRQLRNFIQEKRSAVGLLKIALTVVHSAGERPLDMAEQLRIHQLLGQRATVHHKEIPLPPCTELMNNARHILLTHAAFALNQDTQSGRSKLDRRLQRLIQRRIIADNVVFIL